MTAPAWGWVRGLGVLSCWGGSARSRNAFASSEHMAITKSRHITATTEKKKKIPLNKL